MAADAGIDSETRKTLGYHAKFGDKSVRCYSRNNLDAPVDVLIDMIDSINAGKFDPDKPRGQRWKVEAEVAETQKEIELSGDMTSDTILEASDSSADTDVESDVSMAAAQRSADVLMGLEIIVDGRWFLHADSKLHRGKAGDADSMACGSKVSENFTLLSCSPCDGSFTESYNYCGTCFKLRNVEASKALIESVGHDSSTHTPRLRQTV
jgi:hypothetical protein